MMMVETDSQSNKEKTDDIKTPISIKIQRLSKKHPSIIILSILLASVPMYKFFSFVNKNSQHQQETTEEPKKSDFPEIAFRLPDRGAATTSDAERLIFGKDPETPEKTRNDEFIPLNVKASDSEPEHNKENAKEDKKNSPIKMAKSTAGPSTMVIKAPDFDVPSKKGWRKNTAALHKPANTGEFKKEEKETKDLSIGVGTRIKCRLEISAISSNREILLLRTISSHESMPAGTMLKARTSDDGTRLFVNVFSAVIAGQEKGLRAYAITHNTPGISAIVRSESLGDRQKSKIGSALLDTAKQVAGTAVGGIAGAVLGGSTSGAASEAQHDMRIDRSRVLEVPAGTVFDVVVVE